MPIYTYRCDNCGIQFEKTQKFSDQPLTRCPECSKKSLRKVYTPVGILFKGSGFYSTDNRSPSGQINRSKDASAENKSSVETKSESSPAVESKSTSSSSTSSSNPSETK